MNKQTLASSQIKTQTGTRMPVFFIGHGSPMNALGENSFAHFLGRSIEQVPKPKGILVISAHWITRGTKVFSGERPKTIHDFGGFPKALHEMQYPAPGDLETAERIVELLRAHQATTDENWGLDHGAWTILKFMYPHADIPVLQLSIDVSLNFKQHHELAQKLSSLRDEGVLIIGSGNITHNLRLLDFSRSNKVFDWAQEFDQMIADALIKRDLETLLVINSKNEKLWSLAHPSVDHYIPLIYSLGASDEHDQLSFPYEGMELGSLSMRAVRFDRIQA